jgi:hypothetical protein
MRELKEIIKDLERAKKTSNICLEDIPWKNRGGIQIAMRTATDQMPELIKELTNTLIPSKLIAVYASGSAAIINQVVEFMNTNGGIIVDVNDMYRRIVDRVEQTYSHGRVFTTTQHSAIIQVLRQIGTELELPFLDCPKYVETICPNTASTLYHVRQIIRDTFGDTLNKQYIIYQLIQNVLQQGFEGNRVPILVLNALTVEEKQLLNTLFTVNCSFEFPPDFIVDQKNISKIFKKTSNPSNPTE